MAKIISGTGGQIDLAMYDVMLSQMNYLAGAWLNAGEPASRFASSAHPYVVPAQIFATKDSWISLFISHDGFWRVFCEEVGRPDWIADERLATMAARRQNREFVVAEVGALLHRETTADWVRRLAPLGVVVSGVETLEQALAGDIASSRGMVVTIPTDAGPIKAVGNPIKIEGEATEYRAPPLLGEHNDVDPRDSSRGH